MTAIEKIRAKFWDQLPGRCARLRGLLDEAKNGSAESTEPLASLVHAAKGEAQLLGLEPCASLLELADQLVKATRTATFPENALAALEGLHEALAELAALREGGAATAAAFAALETALPPSLRELA